MDSIGESEEARTPASARPDPPRGAPGRARIVGGVLAALAAVAALIWVIAPIAVTTQSGPAPTQTSLVPLITSTVPAGTSAVMAGPGIDPTGQTVSTDGVRAFIASMPAEGVRVLEVPAGSVIQLDGTIEIPERTIVRGGGELRWTGGIAESAAMSVVGDNVEISGVTLTNPNELGSADGDRNYGIEIKASDVRIIGNHLESFQNGIAVRYGGEYHDIIIAGNRVKDIVGVGGGPDSQENLGEDRGDGIVVWGAQATVTGNVVNAKPGTDARVGIHTESITLDNAADAPHSASMVTISDNVVYGTFRRSIVSENVAHTTITGNTVADATWWGIAIILQSHDSVVSGNTVIYTRTAEDEQGKNYNPQRGPIMIYGGVERALVTGNSLLVAEGATARAYVIVQATGNQVPTDITVDGNTGATENGAVEDGIATAGPVRGLRVTDNRLSGFSANGVAVEGDSDFVIDRNELRGGSGARAGVRVEGSPGQVTDNVISDVGTAVDAPGGVVVEGNVER
ncbi:right-handed parallel beta-helix repeat-containing protein [Microbacterium sp. zg.Y625]|uniref:right-handed parallel beta-helix repeat-containing protein n=1 Tax=Microbacterium jiangjiandongii TaxID=3049071 RepID=UPI00214C4251|nr:MULTISPECIES: right-handed parallel beta-helix repeat-containing protein [unclassified Microbacterium]MCR2792000.1 right-handed parallel beta-helix repeat-containing protein [Microbacterium sp. zg.Y625]WIM24807.1 right-handed parallel beta-helix repeat-containing protein [Microbacterium sp. zg-Y625]